MLVVLGCLAGFNLLSMLRTRMLSRAIDAELLVALLVDVGALTAQLYLSGGTANPFVFLYLLQVVLGAVLLPAWASWAMLGVTSLCFAGLGLVAQPLALPQDGGHDLASPYVLGLLVCFALEAALLVTYIGRITRNLRERDARLAAVRQRAVEEEHIVRMGLLASGAAHELGTPLSTLAVILGDWRHLPHFSSDPELLQDLDDMLAQVARCKSIVSGILLSAGEARGEAAEETTVRNFLDDLVQQWRRNRPGAVLHFENDFGDDMPMVSDAALKQMIGNVLDNAHEASPRAVYFTASRAGDWLRLVVADAGPGFPPAMLKQLGKPYQSSKGQPGRGLGLFLAVNVARTLGGRVAARNRSGGGAEVIITLPLTAVAIEVEDEPDAS
jgi:two-component system sensor histidine kinase RegB